MCKHRLSFLTLILKHSSLVQALFKLCSSPSLVSLFLIFLMHLLQCYSTCPGQSPGNREVSNSVSKSRRPWHKTKRPSMMESWHDMEGSSEWTKIKKSQLRLSILSNSIHIRTSDCGLPWLPFPYLFPYLSFFCLIFFHFFWPCGQVFDPEGPPGCHLRRVWFGILSRLLSKCLNENHEEPVEPKQMKLCQAWWTLMNAEILMNMEAKEI